MIIQFSVQNFGSIKDEQTLSFEADKSTHLEDYYVIPVGKLRLLKLGLIYGANASGKTTILTALNFMRNIVLNPLDKKIDEFGFEPFLFDAITPTQNTKLSLDFIQDKIKYSYYIELNKKAIVSEELYCYNPRKANIFKRTTNLESQFTSISFGSNVKIDAVSKKTLESNTLWNNTVLAGYLKTNIQVEELRQTILWFANHLQALIHPKVKLQNYISNQVNKAAVAKEDIIQILQKADLNISDIILEKDEDVDKKIDYSDAKLSKEEIQHIKDYFGLQIKFEHNLQGKKYLLPFEMESEGTQRYYGFAGILSLLVRKSRIFPIDELESSLHPDLFTHFLLSFLMNSKESQIIATTHNREILGNKDIFRNDVIWITEKSESCATELYSLADFDTSVIRDTSNVLNAYKIGKLGGVPNLGDYYLDLEE